MRSAGVILGLILPFMVQGDEASREQLSANRAKWDALGVTSYRFTLWLNGAWVTETIQIVVWEGSVASARYLVSAAPDANVPKLHEGPEVETTAWRITMPELFDRAEQLLGQPETQTRIEYHPQFGFPTQIATIQPNVSDSNFAYRIDGFKVLKATSNNALEQTRDE
jgi:hypothetical protein